MAAIRRAVWITVLLLAVVSATRAQTTVVAGTVHGPGGSSFGNGTLIVQMPRRGVLNNCSAPAVVVPIAPATANITNGSFSINLIPTDCMSIFTPYKVQVKNTLRFTISTVYWYVTQMSTTGTQYYMGGMLTPGNGNQWIYDAGANATPTGNKNVFTISGYYPAGFQIATSPNFGNLGPSGTTATVVTWAKPFADASYAAVCSVPGGNPIQVSAINSVTRAAINLTVQNIAASGTYNGVVTCRGREP